MREQPPLDDLVLLVLVAERGSIGQVAAERRLSQPSVSRRMDRLERWVGVPLLNRSRRGTTLTPAGRVVVDWAQTLLAATDRFTRSVRSLLEHSEAAVRVAVSMTIGEYYAPGWLARLSATSPPGHVSLTVGNSSEVTALVETGEADLGFVESPTVAAGLRRHRVGWDRVVVAVRPDHPWGRRGSPLPAHELAAAKLAVREDGSGTRETMERALAQHGMTLRPGMVLPSNTALKSAATAGMGPVVVSERALAAEMSSGELIAVSVADLDLRRPLSAVWRAGQRLSPTGLALLRAAATAESTGV